MAAAAAAPALAAADRLALEPPPPAVLCTAEAVRSGCSGDTGSAGMSTAFRPWSAGAVRRLLALKLRGREEEQRRRTRAAVAREPEGTGRPEA